MSIYTVIMVDEHGWVQEGTGNRDLADPFPYMKDEAHFGVVPSKRENPVRKPAGFRVTKTEEQGDPPEPVTINVPWKYCKVVGYDVVEMDQTEKDARDAEIAAEKAAELESKREAEENRDIFKIIFKMCNLHRPENMQITVEEAKAIVNQVITD